MGFIKSTGTATVYTGLFLAVITFLPGLPPHAEISQIKIVSPGDVKHSFELKNRLEGAEVLFSGELKGPESFDSYAGELYTGLHGGYVVKLDENNIVPIAKFGEKCDGFWQEEKCGRPLGLRFNDKGDLFVVDTYYGIFKLDVRTGEHQLLVNTSEPIKGKVPKTPNSLDIASNGDIYWTDSSSDFQLQDGIYTGLVNPSGRLIYYNAVTKKNKVLLENLFFANGVKLSEDESFLIVLETWASRIVKYHLKGVKAGQHEVFIEGLPGLPDNVHSDGQDGFLVTLYTYVDADHPMLTQTFLPHPYIRKLLARLLYLMEAPLKLLQEIYPNPYAERLVHSIGSFEAFAPLDMTKKSVVLRIDKNGKILDGIYSGKETVDMLSSAFIHGDHLWLGSPFVERVLRIPLKQAFPDLAENRKHTVYVREKRDTESVKTQSSKTEAKPVKQATNSNSVKEPAKPATTAKPKSPTQEAPTRKATTMATPKPTAAPQKPVVTPEKSTKTAETPKKLVKKPVAEPQPVKQSSGTTTTPKSPASTPAPPTQKSSTIKTDTPKTSSTNTKPNPGKDESGKSRNLDATVKTEAEKVKRMEQSRPKDTSKTK